jgi:hypothetical protein
VQYDIHQKFNLFQVIGLQATSQYFDLGQNQFTGDVFRSDADSLSHSRNIYTVDSLAMIPATEGVSNQFFDLGDKVGRVEHSYKEDERVVSGWY